MTVSCNAQYFHLMSVMTGTCGTIGPDTRPRLNQSRDIDLKSWFCTWHSSMIWVKSYKVLLNLASVCWRYGLDTNY